MVQHILSIAITTVLSVITIAVGLNILLQLIHTKGSLPLGKTSIAG